MQYVRPELLAETGWLAGRLDDASIRIIDCRTPEEYLKGHIPGAWALHDNWLKDPTDELYVITPEQAGDVLGGLGIDETVTVVAYDGRGGVLAARLWWVLRYYGYDKTKVLNGGYPRWLAEGRETTERAPMPVRRDFTPKVQPGLLMTIDELKTTLGSSETVIWDARREAEWSGASANENPRTGHLPGARWMEWLTVLTDDVEKAFKPADEIEALLQNVGLERELTAVTYCQAGIRAAHAAFTLHLMGYDRVRMYDGSFADWSRDPKAPLA